MSTDYSSQIFNIINDRGLIKLDAPVTLASGLVSQYFIDAKASLSQGSDLAVACKAMVAAVQQAGIEFDAAGGLTLGADQFAHGIAIVADKEWFVIRKEVKGRGTNRLAEGADLASNSRVLLVDDIVTTGGSIQKAYQRVLDTGAQVVAASTLVDRGEVAKEFFDNNNVPYFPLMTYVDLDIPAIGTEEPNADPA